MSVSELADQVRRLEKIAADRRSDLKSAQQIQRHLAESEPIVTEELVTAAVAGSAREAIVTGLTSQGDKLLGPGGTDLVDAVIDIRRTARRSRLLSSDYWTGKRVFFAVVAAIAVPLVALLIERLSDSPLAAVLGAVSALIPLMTAALKSLSLSLTEQDAALVKAEDAVRAKVKQLRDDADNAVIQAESDTQKAEWLLTGRHAQFAKEQEKLRKLQEQQAKLTPGNMLTEWSRERAKSDDYRKHLTVVSTVRNDLKQLEEMSRTYNDSIAMASRASWLSQRPAHERGEPRRHRTGSRSRCGVIPGHLVQPPQLLEPPQPEEPGVKK